jgi:hypothetical protein
MRGIMQCLLGVRGLSNSDVCPSSQGLHEHIQATVMPEINTKSINPYTHLQYVVTVHCSFYKRIKKSIN